MRGCEDEDDTARHEAEDARGHEAQIRLQEVNFRPDSVANVITEFIT